MGASDLIKKIILQTDAKTEKASTQLNALTNVLNHVSSAMMGIITANMRLMQSNIQVRNSTWALIDAERAYERMAISRLELDQQQADLNIKMAERQLLITQRTGRRLDVQQALLNVEKAQRDAALTNFDIESQRWNLQKQQIQAQEQLNMALKGQKLLIASLIIQTASMIVQTTILIGLLIAKITAMIIAQGIATGGAALGQAALIVGAGAAIGGALSAGIGYGIYSAVKPKPPKYGTAPSGGDTYNTSSESNINVAGNIDSGLYNKLNNNSDSNLINAGRRTRSRT